MKFKNYETNYYQQRNSKLEDGREKKNVKLGPHKKFENKKLTPLGMEPGTQGVSDIRYLQLPLSIASHCISHPTTFGKTF